MQNLNALSLTGAKIFKERANLETRSRDPDWPRPFWGLSDKSFLLRGTGKLRSRFGENRSINDVTILKMLK